MTRTVPNIPNDAAQYIYTGALHTWIFPANEGPDPSIVACKVMQSKEHRDIMEWYQEIPCVFSSSLPQVAEYEKKNNPQFDR